MKYRLILILLFSQLTVLSTYAQKTTLTANRKIKVVEGKVSKEFAPDFKLIYTEKDPEMTLKSLAECNYFAPSWKAFDIPDDKIFQEKGANIARGGDGIDDSVFRRTGELRTGDLFYSGSVFDFKLQSIRQDKDTIYTISSVDGYGNLTAKVYRDSKPYPIVEYNFTPTRDGYFSVVYSGAPAFDFDKVEEVWQPMVWQQKRFPNHSYVTLAYQCPIPGTLAKSGPNTVGVLADSREIPFQPLLTRDNNPFGVALRNSRGQVQSLLLAPVLGHINSKMQQGKQFKFTMRLYVSSLSVQDSHIAIARDLLHFEDYRHNEIISMNKTLDNMTNYALSNYSYFIDSLKGCSYSTDVPGSVKNVSSLHPLSLAIVTDNEQLYNKRAYPILEYMLSRDNTLFCLDTLQKVQNPSRKLGRPCATVSELIGLYDISGRNNSFMRRWAEDKFYKYKPIEEREPGRGLWNDALEIYKSTGDKDYLDWAIRGAKAYIASEMDIPQTKLKSEFFWSSYAPKYIALLEMYEETKDKIFLDAALKAAKYYAMFVWMIPEIPAEKVTVNKDGWAPWYWYLKSRGIPRQHAKEETVDAWRLSEIGLVAESPTTGIGHRGVFMAHHAPYFLRLFHYTGDTFLRDIARSALVGRYRNFPGYHINTERTTAYEQADFPYCSHEEMSITSFHYNHIYPNMMILLNYLITDAMDKSRGQIYFPSRHIEGYGYLQNKFYGHASGRFFKDDNVWLWMPQNLLNIDNVELNYIAARGNNSVYLAFMNQSTENVKSRVQINSTILPSIEGKTYKAELWSDNKLTGSVDINDGNFGVEVDAKGLTSVIIHNVNVETKFQQKISEKGKPWKNDYFESDFGRSSALLIDMGKDLKTVYVFLRDDDSKFKKVNMLYRFDRDKFKLIEDVHYPFEFTVPVGEDVKNIYIQLSGTKKNGDVSTSEMFKLSAE